MSENIRKMIDRVKNFKQFVNENNINTKQILFNVAKQTRDYVDKEHNLSGSFGDYCDVVCRKSGRIIIFKRNSWENSIW